MGFYTVLMVIQSILVMFMIGLILIQRTDSDGLGGLGGGGGNQFLSGRAKANLLTRSTSFLAAAFMLTSLALAVMASRMTERSIVDTVTPTATVPKQDAPDAKPTVKQDATGKPATTVPAPAQVPPAVPKPE